MHKGMLTYVAVAAVLVTQSCSSSPHEPNESYVLVTNNTHIPYWQSALAGLRKGAAEMKVKAEMFGPERYDPKGEKDAFVTALEDKPAGVLISAADPNLLSDQIDAALAQGIPVVTMDADAPASKRLFYIGSDNFAAGKLGGQVLAKALNGKGNVVMFTYPKQQNLVERQQGYQSVFDNYPEIKLTRAVDIQGDPAVAYHTAKDLLDSKAKIDAFVCVEAVACPEVGEAVSENNMVGKITIMAMDTDDRTLKWIDQNLVLATIAQKPYTMAYYGIKLLDSIHHHKPTTLTANLTQDPFAPFPTFVDTGTFIVDKSNLAQFRDQTRSQQPATK
jgi:ribose transport system substrate-binding protein